MGNVGRFFCVALPFILTVGSVIAMLVAGLSGITNKSLYLFKVNTTDLSISSSDVTSLLSKRSLPERALSDSIIAATSGTSTTSSDASSLLASGTNITGDNLGLSDVYYVNLWNYCQVTSSGDRQCTKARLNWASNTTESLTATLKSVTSATGQNVVLPDSVQSSIKTFSTVTKWTEIVFIIAYVALGAELLLGIFANCSRAFSCCTFIVAMFAAVAVCAAAALATALASIVVGVVNGSTEDYGVTASINGRFLAAVWIGAACAIGAGFFWMFTICCCAPDHHRSRGQTAGFGRPKHLDDDSEKLPMTGAYAPVGESHNTAYGGSGFGHTASYGAPRTGRNDVAYEPYSHRA